jgi:hypothetical protein
VLIALVALIAFGALRYDHFLGAFNVLSVLRYNSMFALTSLGMAFVIMTAGIDLSVGNDGGLRKRRRRAPLALRASSRPCRRRRRRICGRRGQRVHDHAYADPAIRRHARGHADGERDGAVAGAQSIGLRLLRH